MDNNEKRLVFKIDEDLHARFRIALRYDGLNQSSFIKHIIAGYLTNDPNIRDFIDGALAHKLSNFRKKNRERDRKEYNKTVNNFVLNEKEIENIFDLIESENSDL